MNKELLRLAIPNIISNISVPLLSTVDIIFMGTLSGLHIGAIGVGAMIFSFLFWNFGFLRMGTTGLTAQAFGRQQSNEINLLFQRACLVALVLGIILMIVSYFIWLGGEYLMNVNESQIDMVRQYFFIGITAAPATLLLFSINGWCFGMQNALLPLLFTIVINLINIGISYWLVIVLNMGIAGAAWGTVIAQYAGVILAITLVGWLYKRYFKRVALSVLFKTEEIKSFFNVNRDIFIRTLCLSFTFGFFYSRSSSYGELVLAANVILMQLLNWMSYGIDGFAYAAESLVGKYYGADRPVRFARAIQLSFIWGFGLAITFSLMYGLGSVHILSIFTSDQQVLDIGLKFLPWMILLPLAGFASYIWDGIYIGITASAAMRDTMFISLIVFVLSYFLTSEVMHPNHGLWLSLCLFLFTRGFIQLWWFRTKDLYHFTN